MFPVHSCSSTFTGIVLKSIISLFGIHYITPVTFFLGIQIFFTDFNENGFYISIKSHQIIVYSHYLSALSLLHQVTKIHAANYLIRFRNSLDFSYSSYIHMTQKKMLFCVRTFKIFLSWMMILPSSYTVRCFFKWSKAVQIRSIWSFPYWRSKPSFQIVQSSARQIYQRTV